MFKQSHTERSNHSADVCAAAHQAEAHLDHLTEYLQDILQHKTTFVANCSQGHCHYTPLQRPNFDAAQDKAA